MGQKSADRKKFGITGKPILATRVLARDLDHDFGKPAQAVLAINDVAGTFTSANVYGGDLGKNYDPQEMTHPLPEAGSDKWKKWAKKGYKPGKVSDFAVLASPKAKAGKSKAADKAAAKV